eukprot:TRINITY_DN30854_c0_g1_i1.p1 TRINITY_DN30854_c0_g1~~TRINITY_DN30854_c0_g1_i1.p1  ORF type:complete len:773 (-),score=61.13 TRINITY_DN30854_c0_g1_i1:23-2341(-)
MQHFDVAETRAVEARESVPEDSRSDGAAARAVRAAQSMQGRRLRNGLLIMCGGILAFVLLLAAVVQFVGWAVPSSPDIVGLVFSAPFEQLTPEMKKEVAVNVQSALNDISPGIEVVDVTEGSLIVWIKAKTYAGLAKVKAALNIGTTAAVTDHASSALRNLSECLSPRGPPTLEEQYVSSPSNGCQHCSACVQKKGRSFCGRNACIVSSTEGDPKAEVHRVEGCYRLLKSGETVGMLKIAEYHEGKVSLHWVGRRFSWLKSSTSTGIIEETHEGSSGSHTVITVQTGGIWIHVSPSHDVLEFHADVALNFPATKGERISCEDSLLSPAVLIESYTQQIGMHWKTAMKKQAASDQFWVQPTWGKLPEAWNSKDGVSCQDEFCVLTEDGVEAGCFRLSSKCDSSLDSEWNMINLHCPITCKIFDTSDDIGGTCTRWRSHTSSVACLPWALASEERHCHQPAPSFDLPTVKAMVQAAALAYSDDVTRCVKDKLSGNADVDVVHDSISTIVRTLHDDSLQVVVAKLKKPRQAVLVAVKGTGELGQLWSEAWRTLLTQQREILLGNERVHVQTYFHDAFKALSYDVLAAVSTQLAGLESSSKHIMVVGHSLGGAIASLVAVQLLDWFPDATLELFTYGEPRVGSFDFADLVTRRVRSVWRVVNKGDPVPHLPACRKKEDPCPFHPPWKLGCTTAGPYHHGYEVFVENDTSEPQVCLGDPLWEDATCSNRIDVSWDDLKSSVEKHRIYFGLHVGTWCALATDTELSEYQARFSHRIPT